MKAECRLVNTKSDSCWQRYCSVSQQQDSQTPGYLTIIWCELSFASDPERVAAAQPRFRVCARPALAWWTHGHTDATARGPDEPNAWGRSQ